MKVSRGSIWLYLAAFLLLTELGCGDQYRPVANPIVGPGGQPQATHFAYVVNYNPNGDGSTTKLDVSGNSVLRVLTLGVGSTYEALLPSSTLLFVANGGDDSISAYAASTDGTPTTINLLSGSHPVFLASTVRTNMFVLNSGANSACPNTGSVSTILVSTAVVSNTVCVGVNPVNMVQAAANGRLFVLNQADDMGQGSVTVLDPTASTVVSTLTSANGLGINPVYATSSGDGTYIFVVTQGDGVTPGTLDIITAASATILGSVPLGVKPTYSYLDPVLNRLYVTNTGDNTVSVFDASNVTTTAPFMPLLGTTSVGTAPVGITALPNASRYYVVNSGSSDVTVVSATSFQPLKTIPVGANPTFIAADPTSTKVYVTNKGGSSISIIQTVNDTVATTTSAPPQDPNCTSSCALQEPMMVLTQ